MKKPILLAATLIFVGACSDAPTTSGSVAVKEPRFFIAKSLGRACTRDERGRPASVAAVGTALDRLDANSRSYISDLRRATSLSLEKDAYVANWKTILFSSYAAAASNDTALARKVLDGLGVLASKRRYLDEPQLITMAEANRLPPCYSAGPNTPCPHHTPRFVGRMYANLLISTAVLESFLTEADRATVLPWLREGYETFVAPEISTDQHGIYDFANYGMARLALAALENDMRLARRELSERRQDFIEHIEPSGYIDENSFRGVRGFWYHTYGLDPALSYALVAREWGVDYFRDPTLGPRLRAAVQKTVLGTTNYAKFRAIENRGNAYSTDPLDEIADVHQYALNLSTIAAQEFGIRITPGARFRNLSRLESYSQISGMSAKCYYSAT